MHGYIFQITTKKPQDDGILREDTLHQGDGYDIDYCQKISDEARKNAIATLVKDVLPKGMFELVTEDTIRYNGGAKEWRKEFIKTVRKMADALDTDGPRTGTFDSGLYHLEKYLSDPLGTGIMFYEDEDGYCEYAQESYWFMANACVYEPGQLLYIGGVIDYHY